VLRLQSGQVAVLGGLMQDQRSRTEDTIPGINQIPGLGELLEQKSESNTKTELVIFLRATVIRDPSIDGDFRSLRGELPGDDFFLKPNPARVAPMVGPGEPQR
jgi:general secretion pathway protein D